MFTSKKLLFILIAFLFLSCKTDNKYNYAIKDFRKSLQPYLIDIVSQGIVEYDDSSLHHMVSDKELVKLGQSEHPILRASAFREMLQRKSINYIDIIMSHLDDTAIVATDAGEWGIEYRAVSDDIIEETLWNNNEDKNKVVDQVITNHNYLRAAYTSLFYIQPQEKHYPYIKEMATRERKSIGGYSKPWMANIDLALYGLAKFKKREDIKIIKDLLLSNERVMNYLSFRIMEEFPDTAYLEVFETYYEKDYYQQICRNGNVDNAVEFVQTVASYKHNRSAKILESILNKEPNINCSNGSDWLKEKLIFAIWDNPCDAYLKLRPQIEGKVKEYEKNRITLPPVDPFVLPGDTTVEKIRW